MANPSRSLFDVRRSCSTGHYTPGTKARSARTFVFRKDYTLSHFAPRRGTRTRERGTKHHTPIPRNREKAKTKRQKIRKEPRPQFFRKAQRASKEFLSRRRREPAQGTNARAALPRPKPGLPAPVYLADKTKDFCSHVCPHADKALIRECRRRLSKEQRDRVCGVYLSIQVRIQYIYLSTYLTIFRYRNTHKHKRTRTWTHT